MTIYLENPGVGRKYQFHGAFGNKVAAARKEASVAGGFIRETVIRGHPRYLVLTPRHKHPTATRGRSSQNSPEDRIMARRSRSKRRKRSARRNSPARLASVATRNPPRRRGRRRGGQRNPVASRHRRAGMRRNPPGIMRALTEAAVDGGFVTAGVVGQNLIFRNLPVIVPATVPSGPMLDGLVKDVALIVLGSYAAAKAVGGDRARFLVAGQAYAAYARQIRAANIPTLSTALGEYDPIRLGTYARGIPSGPTVRSLPAPKPNNVARFSNVGIYIDGMSSAPGMY